MANGSDFHRKTEGFFNENIVQHIDGKNGKLTKCAKAGIDVRIYAIIP